MPSPFERSDVVSNSRVHSLSGEIAVMDEKGADDKVAFVCANGIFYVAENVVQRDGGCHCTARCFMYCPKV